MRVQKRPCVCVFEWQIDFMQKNQKPRIKTLTQCSKIELRVRPGVSSLFVTHVSQYGKQHALFPRVATTKENKYRTFNPDDGFISRQRLELIKTRTALFWGLGLYVAQFSSVMDD